MHEVEERESKPTYYLHFSRLGHVVAARTVLRRLGRLGWVEPSDAGDPELLEQRYRLALDAKPLDPESARTLAGFLARKGKLDEAVVHYQRALAGGAKDKIEIHTNLGTIFRLKGQLAEAAKHYRKAIELDPNRPGGHMNLGDVLMAQGQLDQAARSYEQVVAVAPDVPDAYAGWAAALSRQGRLRQAVEILRRGLARQPNHARLVNDLAWTLATCPDATVRDGAEAVRLVERLGPMTQIDNATLLDTMAAAYAEAGQFDRAVSAAERAVSLAERSDRPETARPLKDRLRRYRAGRAFHATTRPTTGSG